MSLFNSKIRKQRLAAVAVSVPEQTVPAGFAEQVRAHWNEAELLFQDVVQATSEGYPSVVLEAAARLLSIDGQSERSFLAYSGVLLWLGRQDEAELILHQYVTQHGLTPTVLAHLGKIQMTRAHWPYASQLLWQALEFDSNHREAVTWWEALFAEQGGPEAAERALEQASTLPGAWRAVVRLAGSLWRRGQRNLAEVWWRRALAIVPENSAAWNFLVDELTSTGAGIELLLPHYDPALHGIVAGVNLLDWLREQNRAAEARQLLQRMSLSETPDSRGMLARHAQELSAPAASELPAQQQGTDCQ